MLVINNMPRKAAAKKTAPKRKTVTRTRSHIQKYSVSGRGGYWDNVKARAREGGKYENAFGDAGHAIAGAPGRALGGLLNRAIYALTGFGDYTVQRNALLETNGPPSVENRGKEFVVRHREFIQDVYTASGTANSPSPFAIQAYSINPGNFNMFPWLSGIADKFQQYRMEGMVLDFRSNYSDAVVTTNGALGTVVLATQYNSGASAFTSKPQMENTQFCQSAKPSQSVLHPIECARSQNVLSELYIRTGAVPSGEDVKTYDFGDFYIATVGIPLGAAGAAVNIGELWSSYQIALLKPIISTSPSTYVDSGFAHITVANTNGYVGGFTPSAPMPLTIGGVAAMRLATSSNIAIILNNNSFSIPLTSVPMSYEVIATWYSQNGVSDTTAGWDAPSVSFGNATLKTGISYRQDIPSIPATNCSGCMQHFFIDVPAATPSVQYAGVIFSTNGVFDAVREVKLDIFINAVPSTIN